MGLNSTKIFSPLLTTHFRSLCLNLIPPLALSAEAADLQTLWQPSDQTEF